MTLEAILDAMSVRVETLTGMKKCYSVTGSNQDDGSRVPIPPSIDDTPVSLLWCRGGTLRPGNTEHFTHRVELHVWERGTGDGYGITKLVPFVELCRVLFRTDMDVNGTATKALMTGYGEIFPQTLDNGQTFLVLPIAIEILETYFSSDYNV